MERPEGPKEGKGELDRLRASRDAALLAAGKAARDATRMSRLMAVLGEPAPIGELLDKILSTVSELFAADIVVMLDPSTTGDYSPLASIGLPQETLEKFLEDIDVSEAFRLFEDDAVIDFAALADRLGMRARMDSGGVGTVAWISMVGRDGVPGAIVLARGSPPFSKEEVDLLSSMAYRIALTLEQVHTRQQLEIVAKSAREIGRLLDREAIAREATGVMARLLSAQAAGFYRASAEAGAELEPGSVEFASTPPPGAGAVLAFLDGLPADEDGVRCATWLEIGHDAARTILPFRSALSAVAEAPRPDRPESLICVFRAEAVGFTEEARRIAALYAGQVAAALENARLYAELRESEERSRELIRNITDVVAVLDEEGRFEFAGEAARSAWGRDPESLPGTALHAIVHPDDAPALSDLIGRVKSGEGENSIVARLTRGEEGAWKYFDVILTYRGSGASLPGIIATFHDVTRSKMIETELSGLAFRDQLTGLSNRKHFLDRVAAALAGSKGSDARPAVIYFDLDDFKPINDRLGHAAGDDTLRTIAERTRRCLRTADLAARLGGDEFTVLVHGLSAADQIIPVLERLRSSLAKPISIGAETVAVGGSFGAALARPEDDADSLLRKADAAMYRAKRQGKGSWALYDPALDS